MHKDNLPKIFVQDFIKKCFLCGCTRIISGKKISIYVVRTANFADLYFRLREMFPKDSEKRTELMMTRTLEAMRVELNKCISRGEQVLIYHDEKDKFEPFKFNDNFSIEKNIVNKFLFSNLFRALIKRKISARVIQQEDLPLLYQKLDTHFNKDNKKEILIYYALYDDINPAPIKGYKFCTKLDRSEAGCRTRSLAQQMLKIKSDIGVIDDRFDEFYTFVNLKP